MEAPSLTEIGNRRLTFKCTVCGNLSRHAEMMSGICPSAGACVKCGGGISRFYPKPKKLRKGGRWTGMGGKKWRTYADSQVCKHPEEGVEPRENRYGKWNFCRTCDMTFPRATAS